MNVPSQLELRYTSKFKRDMKRITRRGFPPLAEIQEVIRLLLQQEPLPAKYKDHALRGEWTGFRDLHIRPDCVLIYEIQGRNLVLTRIGSHADVFD